MALAAVVVVVLLAWGYLDAKNDIKRLSNPKEAAQQTKSDLVAKIDKLVELPGNEEPTIATVEDADKLKSQAFFKNARNGDKVLIYSKSDRAVLYRPSTGKVVESAPVKLGGNNQAQPAAPAPAPAPTESTPDTQSEDSQSSTTEE
jgi:hypothetical protein